MRSLIRAVISVLALVGCGGERTDRRLEMVSSGVPYRYQARWKYPDGELSNAESIGVHYAPGGYALTNFEGNPSNPLHAVLNVTELSDGTSTCALGNWAGHGQILARVAESDRHGRFELIWLDDLVDSTRGSVWKSGSRLHVIYFDPDSTRSCAVDVAAPGARHVRINVSGNNYTRYAGLRFTQYAVVDSVTQDGMVVLDRPDVEALDQKGDVWISRPTRVGKYSTGIGEGPIVFVRKH